MDNELRKKCIGVVFRHKMGTIMTERVKKANKAYCDGHEEEGLEVCNWEEMPGWQMYLKGEITEDELSDRARDELAEMDQTFGKYLRKDEDPSNQKQAEQDTPDEKARVANRIYRKACVDSGMSLCFFNSFKTWQQFVHGEIGEAEFYEKAREEIRKIGAEHRGGQEQ